MDRAAIKIRVPIRGILGLYWGHIGIMEKKMETTIMGSMGGCQNYGPFLGTLNIRGRIITGTQKGTTILTTTQMDRPRFEEQGQGLEGLELEWFGVSLA